MNKDGIEGKEYAKQSLINIWSVLNRHLQYPTSHNLTWDLIHDNESKPANKVFLWEVNVKNKLDYSYNNITDILTYSKQ